VSVERTIASLMQEQEADARRFFEGVADRYGYDLREYDAVIVRDLVERALRRERVSSMPALLDRIVSEPPAFARLIGGLRAAPHAMFSPSPLYRSLRRAVAPYLRTFASVRVWRVGASDVESVYSLAILLGEELVRAWRLYVTDLHDSLLDAARAATVSAAKLAQDRRNYRAAGGRRKLDEYLAGHRDGEKRVKGPLQRSLVFATHNPATDASFNEFHAILLGDGYPIYGGALRGRVMRLAHESLRLFGFLVLGRPALPSAAPDASAYRLVTPRFGIYQKVGP
jgi:chemotaxis protein methyltransferase CheR